jgi:hypothetical protein
LKLILKIEIKTDLVVISSLKLILRLKLIFVNIFFGKPKSFASIVAILCYKISLELIPGFPTLGKSRFRNSTTIYIQLYFSREKSELKIDEFSAPK